MAGAIGAVVELVSRVGAVFLAITHQVHRYTARVAGEPGWTGELVRTADTFTCRRQKGDGMDKLYNTMNVQAHTFSRADFDSIHDVQRGKTEMRGGIKLKRSQSAISPHCSSVASSLLSPQSLFPSQTIDWGMQFPLVHVNWLELHVLISSSAQEQRR